MAKALVLFETDPVFRDRLQETLQGMEVVFNEREDTRGLDERITQDIMVIFGNPSPGFLSRCPQLKWLQLQSSGANGFVAGELGEDVVLTSATGAYGHGVSEHMIGLTVALCKKLHLYRDEQNKGAWRNRGMVKSIQGSAALILGMGDIGLEYARRMKALGAYIIGIRRTAAPKPDYVDEMLLSDKLDDALPRADVVAMILPESRYTMGIMNRERLAKMKPGAILINAGRGSAVDLDALCDALVSGHLEGAGLDVTDPEPLPPGHRLWSLENALITPHVAGGRNMLETIQNVMKLNLENASRFMKGEPLISVIDRKTGYRMGNT